MNAVDIEKSAMHGNDMPDKLNFAEQLLFQSFRCLYYSYNAKIINREQAQKEKQKLLKSFGLNQDLVAMYEDTCQRRIKLAGMSKEVESGDCDRCKKMMRIFDGRAK